MRHRLEIGRPALELSIIVEENRNKELLPFGSVFKVQTKAFRQAVLIKPLTSRRVFPITACASILRNVAEKVPLKRPLVCVHWQNSYYWF